MFRQMYEIMLTQTHTRTHTIPSQNKLPKNAKNTHSLIIATNLTSYVSIAERDLHKLFLTARARKGNDYLNEFKNYRLKLVIFRSTFYCVIL